MPDTTKERRITLRVPPILASRIDSLVAQRRESERKFSLNDWIIEAIRDKADGVEVIHLGDIPEQYAPVVHHGQVEPTSPAVGPILREEFEVKISEEFPKKFVAQFAAANSQAWNRSSWQQRYEALREKQEREKTGGDNW